MEKKQLLLIPALAFLIVGMFALAFFTQDNPSTNVGDTIEYHSSVCKQVTRVDGTIELVECSSNVLYDTGKNLIRDYLGDSGGTGDEVDQIELGNASLAAGEPTADSSEAYTALSGCGMDEATGAYTALAQDGNWTIYYEFTSTCDNVLTNVTHLSNTAAVEFAGNSFTLVTLQTNDKLGLNWTIWAS